MKKPIFPAFLFRCKVMFEIPRKFAASVALSSGTKAPVTDRNDGALNAAGFSFGRHAFFVVSEMDAADNTLIARAIYPAMRRHIEAAGA